ncbi:unnamed protein product [Lathyrus sativus]|nr:unnamed protein product [Lathyrus sativus]
MRTVRSNNNSPDFAILVEGVSALVSNVIDTGCYRGFMVKDEVSVEIIQFADDTLLIGRGGWHNLWTIKEILRGFELVSGLCVNFNKTHLIGLNVSSHFLFFLLRNSNWLDPETWSYLIDDFEKNFGLWKGRYLWFAGGSVEKSKIHWVKWDSVCRPKEQRDLGIKWIEVFNLEHLSKWKWRIL